MSTGTKPVHSLGICIFTIGNAVKVAAVKKIVCYLLIVWLTLMSGGANAHATQDAAHKATHAHDHASHSESIQPAANDIPAAQAAKPEATHADVCSQSHCGHSHAAGLVAPHTAFVKSGATNCGPTSSAQWASSALPSSIDRPKWLLTTPTVVSLLS